MTKPFFFYLVQILFLSSAFAQTPVAAQEVNRNKFIDGAAQIGRGSQLGTFDNRYEGIRGSSFLYEDWKKGKVILSNGNILDDLFLKYDIYSNQLLLKKRDQEHIFMSTQIEYFEFIPHSNQNPRRFKAFYLPLAKSEHEAHQFYEVLYQGKYLLLRQPIKIVLEADLESSFNSGRHYDEFISKDRFYVRDKENRFHRFKLSAKGLVKVLPQEKSRIKSMQKQYGFDLSSVKGLVELLEMLE